MANPVKFSDKIVQVGKCSKFITITWRIREECLKNFRFSNIWSISISNITLTHTFSTSHPWFFMIACMYRLVMISIDLSQTAQKKHTGNARQISVQDKIQCETKSKNFFSNKIIFPIIKKNSRILSQTEFCLWLNLSGTAFYLGLHTAVVFRM